MRNGFLAIAALAAAAFAPVASGVFGDWSTDDGTGVIRVAPCGGEVCGSIAGMKDLSGRDWRDRPDCGLVFIRVHRVPGASRLHGSVTNPETGRTYDADLWVGNDGVLRLRGYLGLEVFGSTQRWPRFNGTLGPGCVIRG